MSSTPHETLVDVAGYRLWTQLNGNGLPTVVFESGGGDDASVWSSVEPELRRQRAISTFLYDRAGLGRSELRPGPYRVDDEVRDLQAALTARGVHGPVIIVSHSYGGFVSLLTAARDPRISGLVLVDANLPGFFDTDQVRRLLERFQDVAPAMEREAPTIARVMIPLMAALPTTARELRETPLPTSLPVIDIVAERSWIDLPDEVDAMRREHERFVGASPNREAVFATGSGHYVMRDRPDLVVEAVVRLIDRLRENEQPNR